MWGYLCWKHLIDIYACENCRIVSAEGATIYTTQNQNTNFITFDFYNVI